MELIVMRAIMVVSIILLVSLIVWIVGAVKERRKREEAWANFVFSVYYSRIYYSRMGQGSECFFEENLQETLEGIREGARLFKIQERGLYKKWARSYQEDRREKAIQA